MNVQLCLICLDYDGVYDKTRVHICVCVHTSVVWTYRTSEAQKGQENQSIVQDTLLYPV